MAATLKVRVCYDVTSEMCQLMLFIRRRTLTNFIPIRTEGFWRGSP